VLKRQGVADAESVARATMPTFAQFPHWQRSSEQETGVRRALYKALIDGGVDVQSLSPLVDRLLTTLRRAAS
jgi:hypothetical protein